ncbi:MAG: 50S ribosomal protein L15 [Candidatus Omnitrophota bacterium]|nr:50S ribosomal protein L15 [Candidatus Omnitrophota bacterium]
MQLHELISPYGSHKRRKIVGRGPSSGHGKTACRGSNGQNARSGTRRRPGFEGGQMPLIRRVPKRGFNRKFPKEVQIVNLKSFTLFKEDSVISPEILQEKGLIKDKGGLIKILGSGEIHKPLVIKAHNFSQGAKEKIEKAGGKVEIIPCLKR